MNDFTKEDLEIIHLDMCTYVESNKILKESPSHKALREKIAKMIDNYCDHLWSDDSGNLIFCSKCQVYGGKR